MSGLVDGAVVVITGGASGIGRAAAIRLAEEGAAAVVIADIISDPREGGEPTMALVEKAGAKSAFVECDVQDLDAIQAAIDAAEQFGGVSVLVNCAGIFRAVDFLSATEADYDLMMDINVKGTYFACQAAAKSMVAGGRSGSIINLSSVAGLRGGKAYSTYNASKGAVRLLSYSLAGALAEHGIRVNAVHPGIIATEMATTDVMIATDQVLRAIPLGRHGTADDVASAIVYLASPLSGYITGTSQVVDGGMTYSHT